ARQARGAGGRDQAPGRSRGQRQAGLSHRDPDPLGLRRHRRRPGPDQGRQLARQRADAVRGRRQLADAGVQGVPGEHREDLMDGLSVASMTTEAWARRRRRARQLVERHSFAADLARAATAPVLEALGAAAGDACSGRPAEGGCPRCGGLPQLSYLTDAGETLVSGPRMLLCCRCGESWIHQRMTCAGCGEQATSKLPIFADAERFPHLRADACEQCRRYLITIDLRKEPEAVPVVDELVALPLDLYVKERGFTKIVPNLMAIG